MKITKHYLVFVLMTSLVSFTFGSNLEENTLKVYPAPEGAVLNTDFIVQVRTPGLSWMDLDEYMIKVAKVEKYNHQPVESSMVSFDFSGSVQVKVKSNVGQISSARIRPLSYDIPFKVEQNEIIFSLDQPRNISVEVNGDIFKNLHLFANPIEQDIPDKNDPDVIFFGPGIHEFEDDVLMVPSGKTVYVSGGAILMGQLLIHDVQDVKILGRGVIDHTVKMGIHIQNSENVEVEGLFTTQCATGGSNNVKIRNVKSISYFGWGDGFNVFASSNVLLDGVFARNSDDCTTVYATRKGHEGSSRNITMQNSTLWADVAHPIFIGIHGNAKDPDTIENVTYRNIDILDHKEAQLNYQGAMAINAGDNNTIKNIRFEDIRVEDFRQGQLVNIRIFFNPKYCAAPGQSIENVYFKNIDYNGSNAELSVISGYNEERRIKNITFENLNINGTTIYDKMDGVPGYYLTSDVAGFYIGEHVENVSFINSSLQREN